VDEYKEVEIDDDGEEASVKDERSRSEIEATQKLTLRLGRATSSTSNGAESRAEAEPSEEGEEDDSKSIGHTSEALTSESEAESQNAVVQSDDGEGQGEAAGGARLPHSAMHDEESALLTELRAATAKRDGIQVEMSRLQPSAVTNRLMRERMQAKRSQLEQQLGHVEGELHTLNARLADLRSGVP